MTEEDWIKKEGGENKLLLTREEWQKRMNMTNLEGSSNAKNYGVRDKSKVRCFNCQLYGHFAAECRKPKRPRENKQEALMAKIEEDDPLLL